METSISLASPVAPPLSTTPPDPSSSLPSSSKRKPGLHPNGPNLPSDFSPGRAAHARRPSRAERYEALVAGAREVLRRGSAGLEEVGLGFEHDVGGGRGKEEKLDPVQDREWREAVRSLLKVVDGMTQQLATHDELAAQLKIAQSNLTLAESHSEFLEDTLRRRDSRSSSSHQMGRHNSSGGVAPPLPRSRATTDDITDSNGAGLFGLGFSNDDPSPTSGKSFFRLPSKRKPTPSTASVASTSTTNSMPPPNPPYAQTLRSVSSSPRLGDYSPNPMSPPLPHPRFSTSTAASSILDDPSPRSSRHNPDQVSPTPSELFALQSQVTSLETECTALRSSNASLKRNNVTLVSKCAELEKTKEDLMSELENLSVELFSEANTLVAEERKARASAEDKVKRLRADIDSLNSQLTILRQLIASRSASSAPSPPNHTSPDLPAIPSFHEPATPPMGITATLQPYHDSPARLPSPVSHASSIERPISTVSVASTSSSSGRKWFSFGRSGSVAEESTPVPSGSNASKLARAASHPTHTDSLHPPPMQRADSGSSNFSDTSATSFFSFRSANAPSSSAADASPEMGLRSSAEEDRPRVASGKGKEKARELDLGIYVPGAGPVGMAKTDSEGGRTVGARTPVTAEHARRPYSPGLTRTNPGEHDQHPLNHVSSPPLPPLPSSTPHIASSSFPAPSHPRSTSPSLPPPGSSTTPTLAPPTARPPRTNGTPAPRPPAIHTSLTPPLLSPASFSPSSQASFESVGGPRAEDMTAASKSPKSPNAMRWTEVAGTLAGADGRDERRRGEEGRGTRSRSNSWARSERDLVRDKLPPSPALPDGFKENTPLRAPIPPASSSNRAPSPLPHPPRPAPPPSIVETASSPARPLKVDIPVPPVLAGGVKALVLGNASVVGNGPASARPASPAIAARPALPPSSHSSTGVPTSSSSHRSTAIPLAPSSAAPAPSPTVESFVRPGFLRADSASSVTTASGRPRSPGAGMTSSTSASSLASRSSAASGSTVSSNGGTGGKGGLRLNHLPQRHPDTAGSSSRPLSPDGTKAVEDLESLMASILAMDEELGKSTSGASEGKTEEQRGKKV
ncbi:hypothetical protein JCM8547_000657 [Rhodosporidiobolus lusitaniae]